MKELCTEYEDIVRPVSLIGLEQIEKDVKGQRNEEPNRKGK